MSIYAAWRVNAHERWRHHADGFRSNCSSAVQAKVHERRAVFVCGPCNAKRRTKHAARRRRLAARCVKFRALQVSLANQQTYNSVDQCRNSSESSIEVNINKIL